MRLAIILMTALVWAPPLMAQQHSGTAPDCFCTDAVGARVEMGQSICLTVGGRAYIARCEMVLNNPAWRDTGADCTLSNLRERLKPSLYPRSVHPKI